MGHVLAESNEEQNEPIGIHDHTFVKDLPWIAGDLYNVSFTEVGGHHGNRFEKLMRIQEVKMWKCSDGFMVLITDALKLGDALEGWIVLDWCNELHMHEAQFLPAGTCMYRVLSAQAFESMIPELRKRRQERARVDALVEAQQEAAERARIFAPSPQYLRVVPIEQTQKNQQNSCIHETETPSEVSGCASAACRSGSRCGVSIKGNGSLSTGACGSSESRSLLSLPLVQWCGGVIAGTSVRITGSEYARAMEDSNAGRQCLLAVNSSGAGERSSE